MVGVVQERTAPRRKSPQAPENPVPPPVVPVPARPLPHRPNSSSMLLENLPRTFSCKIRTRKGEVPDSDVGVALAAGTEGMLPRPRV